MQDNNILKSKHYESENTKIRVPFPVKKYATEGSNIPLKKNWSDIWCLLPAHFDKISESVLNFEVKKTDVFVATYMKSGTTWMQECAWLLLNNLDFQAPKETNIMVRSPYLEIQCLLPNYPITVEMCQQLPEPRLIKTHLPPNLMPLEIWQKKPKIIHVARNVKDVIVSSFHFNKGMNYWIGNNLAEYVEDFINSEISYCHYWSHLINFWLMRHEPFIFFVTYEEMKKDLAGVLQRLCKFLEKPQLSKEDLKKIINFVEFDCMKKTMNPTLSKLIENYVPEAQSDFKFMRRGVVGSFNDELTPELIEKIDKWTDDCLLQYGIKEEDIFGNF